MKIEITIWNDKGEVVVHDTCDAPEATEAEIAETISLIQNGMPAHEAARLAKLWSKYDG